MGEKIENSGFVSYEAFLKDKHRPPSKGGNTRAWHQHVIVIAGVKYSFLACGSKQWAYKGDKISFEWDWDPTKTYRNIVKETFRTVDRHGNPIVRGIRGDKPWRTATTRAPVSRREWRD